MALANRQFLFAAQVGDAQTKQLMLQLLGLRTHGLAAAAVLPVFLTAILFLGPLSLVYLKWQSSHYIDQINRTPLEVRRSRGLVPCQSDTIRLKDPLSLLVLEWQL